MIAGKLEIKLTDEKNAANKTLGEDECKKPRKPWITLEMIEKMDEERKWKC